MSEHNGSFADTFAPVVSENGHEAAPEPEAASVAGARVDPARGVFITSRGNDIELSGKRVSSLMIERIINQGKPHIPMKEVMLLGKHKQMEANPNDPGYLALVTEWENNQKVATLIYLFSIGVKGQPPADFVEEQTVFFPDASATDLKYLWVASRLPDDDVDMLAAAILGQTLPTEKGLEDAANFMASASTETR